MQFTTLKIDEAALAHFIEVLKTGILYSGFSHPVSAQNTINAWIDEAQRGNLCWEDGDKADVDIIGKPLKSAGDVINEELNARLSTDG